ncbi:hypothetical protein VA7_gp29 [Bacteroides phage GEC_vB_Bfr_VA7]|nr:hypothetical protein VA7_gp29 [Bacteroides phage GEC_vB_Bfr_VA7]
MKEVIDFKIGEEYKEGDILKTREGIYLLVEKSDNKHCVECCYLCWFRNAPWDVCVQIDCTAGNFYFRPFEEYHKKTEYIIGDLLKIPKEREPGKFILAKVEDEGYTKEICYDCEFHQNHFELMECCVANKCVAYFRDTEKDDIYYKPLAEVSE